ERGDRGAQLHDVELRVLHEERVVCPGDEADAALQAPAPLVPLQELADPAALRLGQDREEVRVLARLALVRAPHPVDETEHLLPLARAGGEPAGVRRGDQVARGRDLAVPEAPGALRDLLAGPVLVRCPELLETDPLSLQASTSSRSAAISAARRTRSPTRRC